MSLRIRRSLLVVVFLFAGPSLAFAFDEERAPPASADELAERVHRAAGGEALARVAALQFSFVVVDAGTEVFRADHLWDRFGGRDRVWWQDGQGRTVQAVVDLETKAAEVRVDGTASDDEKLAAQAYRRWVNDTYWLMLPLKLGDPGVTRTLEEDRDGHHVLRLEFGGVGLTPGDVYWLFVDPETDRIVRWEMVLEGREPPPVGYSWVDYREVGPLMLAHDHVSDDGARHIRFEEVMALPEVDPGRFALPGAAASPAP